MSLSESPITIRSTESYWRVVSHDDLLTVYLAGVLDSRNSFMIRVGKERSYRFGFSIAPIVRIKRNNEALINFLCHWSEENGIKYSRYESGSGDNVSHVWEISDRDEVAKLIEIVEPYLLIHDEMAIEIRDELIPMLQDRVHSTEDGFLEVMEVVDSVREKGESTSSKYDLQFFEDYFSSEQSSE